MPAKMQDTIDRLIRTVIKNKRVSDGLIRLSHNMFLKFCFVGGISTIVNYGSFLLLLFIGVNYLISAASGYILGVWVGFVLNRSYTFKSKSRAYAVQMIKYFLVYTFTLLLGLSILKGLVYLGLHPAIANLITLIPTTISNYSGCKLFVFDTTLMSKMNFYMYRYKYLLRYVLIGLGSIVVEVLVISLLKNLQQVTPIRFHEYVFILIGFLSGVLFSFYLNSTINFPVPKERNLKVFRMFLLISVFAFILNLVLMRFVFARFFDYSIMRFITAGIVFMLSYTLHRRFTFTDIKEVGVAVYLKKSENIAQIKKKIGVYCDFIHLDLVDQTIKKDAEPVDLSKGPKIKKEWPGIKKMIHIMSRKPSRWISKVQGFTDIIIFHLEVDEDISKLISQCKKHNKKVGISVMYDSVIDDLIRHIKDLDIVQVLGVPRPGHSAQSLHPDSLDKLEILNALKDRYNFDICFDGGVKLTNINRIKARYIVSASTIIKSADSVRTIYDLKTSSSYYQDKGHDLKRFIREETERIIKGLEFVKSGTFVGSFLKSEGLQGISDIDIVLIIDKLSKRKYETIINSFRQLEGLIRANFSYEMKINSSFGPLKFNKKKTAVFHLMIYDAEGHIEHCIKSPFTCLDWQHSEHYIKEPMTSIYAVTHLQPDYFFSSRRGIRDYMKDLNKDTVSYREYDFSKGVREIKKHKKMDDKDRFEFSYHIMKLCMLNLVKLVRKEYREYSLGEIINNYFKVFPKNREKYTRYVLDLRDMKIVNRFPRWKSKNRAMVESFLKDFESQFRKRFEKDARKHQFIRHQKTEKNKPGVFLGSRDPDICEIHKPDIKDLGIDLKYKAVFSSPMKRCKQTAEKLSKGLRISTDPLLKEIEYGKAEGKDYSYLEKNHPDITEGWMRGEDPRFPGGENMEDVKKRVLRFLDRIKDSPDSLVCTHRVFLQALVGHLTNMPLKDWHNIDIPHLETIEVIVTEDRPYINLKKEQLERIKDCAGA